MSDDLVDQVEPVCGLCGHAITRTPTGTRVCHNPWCPSNTGEAGSDEHV